MVTVGLAGDVHCRLPEALRAMHLFAILHSESRLTALGRPGIEFICEPLVDEGLVFAHWVCRPPFQLAALCGVVSASANGLTTTITFDAIYESEAGIVGALFDRCIGRRFAKGAAVKFFQRLLRFIEQEAGLDNILDRLLESGQIHGPRMNRN